MKFGFFNEAQFIDEVNGKKVKQLPPFLKAAMNMMFEGIDPRTIITATKCHVCAKPDICIEANGEKKYISLKSNSSESVHQEELSTFLEFLNSIGVSKRTQETIALYHYGDDTLDGTGEIRHTRDYLMEHLKDRLEEANEELSNKQIIEKVIERCVFKSRLFEELTVDYLIHGTVEFGIVVGREEFIRYTRWRKCMYLNTLHIGPITLHPWLRDVERRSPEREDRRQVINARWPRLSADMEKVYTNT